MTNQFRSVRTGDWVVYTKQKSSTRPAARAHSVMPSSGGETYRYAIEKYWIVDRVLPNGSLILRTRRGKRHEIEMGDPNLRRANLFERLFMRGRFADFDEAQSAPEESLVAPRS